MSLKSPILDILSRLREIEELRFVKVYNNHFDLLQNGEMYTFPFPCAFVETVAPQFGQLGMGYQQADVDFRIHIGHEQYDAGDGDMEQNLTVMDLRDKVVAKLSGYRPAMCSELFKTTEQQDYAHTNIYHYVVEFRAGFIDDTASQFSTDEGTGVDGIEIIVERVDPDEADQPKILKQEIIIQ